MPLSELSHLNVPLPELNARMSNKKVSEVIFEKLAHESFFRDLVGKARRGNNEFSP